MLEARSRQAILRASRRLDALAPSQIREMMRIASEVGAINMAQGRPDFPAAEQVKDAALAAIRADHNQYSVTWGVPELRVAVQRRLERHYGLHFDPDTQITITCGVTEAMVAAVLALVDPGDEVVIIEPAHENYLPAVLFAGATPRFVAMEPPNFELDWAELERAINPATRLVIVNTPHNPTGRVLTRESLQRLAALVSRYDALVLTDEIYDTLVYDGRKHVPPASVPELAERAVSCFGISKIHAVTGWRLGFVAAPPELTKAIRTVHDFLTICAPTPFQHAAIVALDMDDHLDSVRAAFQARRDRMMDILRATGFSAVEPEGAYYTMASYADWGFTGSSEAFVQHLITQVGVAVVPGPAFYPGHPQSAEGWVRFAFAKTDATLDEVKRRLARGYAAAKKS